MKIKISKRQWENIGKTAGWSPLKESQNMDKQMDDFFSPSIILKRHIMNGKIIEGYWYVDLNKDFQLARQLIEEAGIKGCSGNELPRH